MPLLVRYEVINADNRNMPGDFTPTIPDRYEGRFGVRAILYWAYLAPQSGTPRRAIRITSGPASPGQMTTDENPHRKGPAGFMVGWDGPEIAKVRIEVVDYLVSTDRSRRRQEGSGETLLLGAGGWTVQDDPQVLSSIVVPVGKKNSALPVFDLSAVKLDPKTAGAVGFRGTPSP